MLDRRTLFQTRSGLDQLGTFKTGSELLNGDIIYGIAVAPSKSDLNVGDSISKNIRLTIYNSYYVDIYYYYSKTQDQYYQSQVNYREYMAFRLSGSYYVYLDTGKSAPNGNTNVIFNGYGSYYYMAPMLNNSGNAYESNTMPFKGYYTILYFGDNLSLHTKYTSSDDAILGKNLHLTYTGKTNTFGDLDNVLFLTTPILDITE